MTRTQSATRSPRSRATLLGVKTLLDMAVALPGLGLFMPLLALLAVLIKLDSPGPVIHRRRVVGRGGKQFDAYKLRTMYVEADALLSPAERSLLASEHKLKNDPRVTRVGRFLRQFSLDELPQLLNVIRGQMSLVGPRIITAAEFGRYGADVPLLLSVKPGLTGPWQIGGRSDLDPEERVRLDLRYAREVSLLEDLRILIRTPVAVLTGRGAY
jgi:lipopolysaccharide/colanic/teichoic acid biosynthesis glycosyltransferase